MSIIKSGDLSNDVFPTSSAERQQQLFEKLAQVCVGFSIEDVLAASYNLVVNAMCKAYPKLGEAESRYNDWGGKFRGILRSRYDTVTGRKKTIVSSEQNIAMDLFVDKDQF